MSPEPVHVSRKEMSSDKVLEYLDSGRTVVVSIGKLGIEKQVTLRKSSGEYKCDTGLKLFAYEDRDEMKDCIERLRLTA